ncbi:hypothetical protein [Thalassospira sp.]|uniref:hypothetical protein n=1 Tax=Thalassospira sp. TaxID=1912094 RepID=UPI001B1E60B5|nr:hypothetical protein [Thalassospira sp.]MBO6841658.1 hypothetical protein [Thalassospira sp.]
METKITRYQSYSGTIAAGDTFVINRKGRSVTCLSASDDLEIVIDDGSRSFFTAGISMEFDEPFAKVQLHNPTASPVTFLIATAMGKVDDNRLTASGNIKVLDPGAGSESFADVIAEIALVRALMQNDEDKRKGLSSLGASAAKINAGATATWVQLINPASNTSGIIVRSASVANVGSVNHLVIDTASPSGSEIEIATGRASDIRREDFFLPSGYGLYAKQDGHTLYASANWDVL